jgi:NAD+ diphosphatase
MADYPDLSAIPFNQVCIGNHFAPRDPRAVPPSGPGYWALLRGNDLVLRNYGDSLLLPVGELPAWLKPTDGEPLCIGLWQGMPLRIGELTEGTAIVPPYTIEPLNAPVQRVDDATLTIGGLARQILHWDQRSGFCSRCGGATERAGSSWGKRCTACGSVHFPHLHPCAIVLVRRGREVLLVHKPEWPDGRYSLVAGFVEFGESLEECAAREVREETGIEITGIRYVASQNWPFPAQLMAGFTAEYAGGEIVVNRDELEDVRWFPVDALPTLPPRRSIARRIIDTFCR